MDPSLLRADCGRCAALCCTALAFDRSAQFAHDKPAGEPCANLTQSNQCSIYAVRAQSGFSGCVAYDCLGAGQRVVQEVFEGRTWREDPSLARPMFEAFAEMRRVHELLQLLTLAGRLNLTVAQETERTELMNALDPAGGWTRARLQDFSEGPLAARVQALIADLRQNDTVSAWRYARG